MSVKSAQKHRRTKLRIFGRADWFFENGKLRILFNEKFIVKSDGVITYTGDRDINVKVEAEVKIK